VFIFLKIPRIFASVYHQRENKPAVFKVGILQCITVILLFSQISALLFLFLYCNFINIAIFVCCSNITVNSDTLLH
jgi:hypothetical protein